MSKNKNFSGGYFLAIGAMVIAVSGGAIVGARMSERRSMGALAGAGVGLLGAYAYFKLAYAKATRPAPKKDQTR